MTKVIFLSQKSPPGALVVRALLCAFALATADAHAQEYPARVIKIVAGFPPGGAVDLLARITADRLNAKWGQAVVVENRPGAAGNIATEAVSKAEPDGHTLLLAPPSFVINPLLYVKLAFDSAAFVPVTTIAGIPNVLMVDPKLAANSVLDLIALAKANPSTLNYASAGSGGTPHLTAELFKSRAGGLKITHVPYKGGSTGPAAVMAGEVQMMFFNLGGILPHIRAGKLKVLAVLSEQRIASLPGVPAMAELFPGFVSIAWFGMFAPPKTPMPIAEKLAAAIAEALKQPDVLNRLAGLGADPIGNSPSEMAVMLKQETDRWGEVIRAAGVKVE